MKTTQPILWILAALFLGGCAWQLSETPQKTINELDNLSVSPNFSYATTKGFSLEITAQDNHGIGLKHIPISFSYKTPTDSIELGTMLTDNIGKVTFANTLPDYIDSLIVFTTYPGLPREQKIKIEQGLNTLTLGGTKKMSAYNGTPVISSNARIESKFSFLGSYDNQGVPSYLEPVNDYVPQDILDLIDNSLPERQPVPIYHPEYLNSNLISDIQLKDSSEVFVTFVTEGAGYRNSLGYYTYDLSNPPTSASQISKLNIIFPNLSLPGSGGNLPTGSKVRLGAFPANTGIGWFLVPNGFNGRTVTEANYIHYSNRNFNTFTTAAYTQHVIILKDDARELLFLSFEDLNRPGGDNDFNDAIFYITANPYKAVNTDNFSTIKTLTGTDTDQDGVIDRNDAYPTDPDRAFDVYTPGKNVFGSLAFEDNWPAKGDYDMNDLVIDYNFHIVTNSSNAVKDVNASLLVRAVGAAYQNGFGIQIPTQRSNIASAVVSNQNFSSSSILEVGQQQAVLVLFNNAQSLFNASGLLNTRPSEAYHTPVPLNLTITLNQPVKQIDLGYAPFNPFIFVNGNRSVEVHLPDMQPTQLANQQLFGTQADSSIPSSNRYYRSGNNLPWAINIANSFDYPAENQVINETYLMFSPWAKSNGTSYKDWFRNNSGYRNNTKIYKH